MTTSEAAPILSDEKHFSTTTMSNMQHRPLQRARTQEEITTLRHVADEMLLGAFTVVIVKHFDCEWFTYYGKQVAPCMY